MASAQKPQLQPNASILPGRTLLSSWGVRLGGPHKPAHGLYRIPFQLLSMLGSLASEGGKKIIWQLLNGELGLVIVAVLSTERESVL